MFLKIGALINFPIFTRKYLCWTFFLIKLQARWPTTVLKRRPKQVFYCENHKMFQNSFIYGTPLVAASENGGRISKNL